MIGAAVRLILRLVGWLLTPLVVLLAATLGATLGFLATSQWPSGIGLLIFAFVCAMAGALLATLGWTRLLRRSPQLREALAVTTSGLPEPEAVEEMIQTVTHEEKPQK